jgi:hypothetical protein
MARPVWREHRASLPLQPMEPAAPPASVWDRVCYSIALLGLLMLVGRALVAVFIGAGQ